METNTIKYSISTAIQITGLFILFLFFTSSCSESDDELFDQPADSVELADFLGNFKAADSDCDGVSYDLKVTIDPDNDDGVILYNFTNAQDRIYAVKNLNNSLDILPQKIVRNNKILQITGAIAKTDFGLTLTYHLQDGDVISSCTLNGYR